MTSTSIAVILIDCQNEFAKPGGKLHSDVEAVMEKNRMLEKIQSLVAAARKSSDAIIIHSPSVDKLTEYKRIPSGRAFLACAKSFRAKSSRRGSWNAKIADELYQEEKSSRPTYFGAQQTFTMDSWNAEIVSELHPEETDVVLGERTHASVVEGTQLKSVIEENDIQTVILLGFLSDVSIVETAIGLSDEFPDLDVLVCSDGTASSVEQHHYAIKNTLPMIGVGVITCDQAMITLKGGIDASKTCRSISSSWCSVQTENEQRREEVASMHKSFDVFQFQSLLRGAGVLIPSDVLVSVFVQGSSMAANKGQENDPFVSFTLEDLGQLTADLAGEKENVFKKSLLGVVRDFPSAFNFTAGFLLLIGLFKIPDSVNHVTAGLLANVFYLIAIGKSVLGMPIDDLKGMTRVHRNVRVFKQRIKDEAAEYESEKQMNRISVLEMGFKSLPQQFVQQMQYIEEVIFSDSNALTRTDVEMLLLRELGTMYTPQTLVYCISTASRSNSSSLSPVEIHSFIVSKDESRIVVIRYLKRLWFIFRYTLLSLSYLMGLSFFFALVFSIVNWLSLEFVVGVRLFAYTWLYIVGTLGFSSLAFERIKDAYEMKERARCLLSDCLGYAQYYNKDKYVWQKYNRDQFIEIHDFSKLLESSDVLLSETEIAELIREINVDEDDIITKDELESYLELKHKRCRRHLTILRNCIGNFSFIANLSWFVGAIGYAMAYYTTENAERVGNVIGAVGYFLGGSSYAFMTFQSKKGDLDCLIKLKVATKRICRTSSRRFGVGDRKTLVQTILMPNHSQRPKFRASVIKKDEESASPRLSFTHMNWIKHRATTTCDFPGCTDVVNICINEEEEEEEEQEEVDYAEKTDLDPLERYLSSIISYSEGDSKALMEGGTLLHLYKLEWSPTTSSLPGSLLMYRLRLNNDYDEEVGFLIYPGCREEDVAKIFATLSDDGSKLLITFPSYSPIDEDNCEGDCERAGDKSIKVSERFFGPPCPMLVEATVSWNINSFRGRVAAPTLIHSRNKTRSILHFQLIGVESEENLKNDLLCDVE